MKPLFLYLLISTISLLSVSCDHRTKKLERWPADLDPNVLIDYVLLIDSDVNENRPTNGMTIVEYANSYISYTNHDYLADYLRSNFDGIWINHNPNDWLSNTNRATLLLVARYKDGDKRLLVGMNIHGERSRLNESPKAGFTKLGAE